MTIAPAILEHYPDLSDAQRDVVGHLDGPLLVIAGPGSGKTYSIVLRALNLLLLEKAQPKELVLCTFTEKAAFEMRDRLAAAARKVDYQGDLSELTASTIHGLCNRVLTQHRHLTELGHNFETLDDLTQLLFVFEHFDEIIGPSENDLFLGHWSTRWTAIQGARGYFDKITEELVDPEQLIGSSDAFLVAIGRAYQAYDDALTEENRIDFAHLQSTVLGLLDDPATSNAVTSEFEYVLVDEYQDTNFVQERLLFKLTETTRNLCVVGDEDQSLYRFRGATVRNILEFPQRMPGCAVIKLTTNYRSHRAIVEHYDHWMASADWSNPGGTPFRYDKTIEANKPATHPDYPSAFAIWGKDKRRGRAFRGPGRVPEGERDRHGLQPGGASIAQRAAGSQRALFGGAGDTWHPGFLPASPCVLRERRHTRPRRLFRRALRLARCGPRSGQGRGGGARRLRGRRDRRAGSPLRRSSSARCCATRVD